MIKLFSYLYYKAIISLTFTSGDHVTFFDKHIQIMCQLYNIFWIWFELHQEANLQIQTSDWQSWKMCSQEKIICKQGSISKSIQSPSLSKLRRLLWKLEYADYFIARKKQLFKPLSIFSYIENSPGGSYLGTSWWITFKRQIFKTSLVKIKITVFEQQL